MRTSLMPTGIGYALALWLLLVNSTHARDFESDFDGPEVSWQLRCRERDARLETHERRRENARRGKAEFVRLRAVYENAPMRLELAVPPMRVLDEFTARLWVRSDRPGAELALRIAFRGIADPKTGGPLTMIVTGEKYEAQGEWQQLHCRTTDKAIKDQLHLLRARHPVKIDPNLMYVEQVIVGSNLVAGTTEFLLDDLTLGPVVPMDFEPGTGPAVPPARKDGESSPNPVPVEFRLHRLRVDGKPFLPRIVPFRRERPDVLADAGFNATWVPDVETLANTGQFRERGVWLTATPPFARGTDGTPLDSDDASLLPFNSSSNSVLFWMLGARLTADSRPRLAGWSNQIRDADRTVRRPLAADMASDERIASRHLDLVGLSRHVLNSGLSFIDYRDEIIARRNRAWPGTFCFTWLQTEPAAEFVDLARVSDATPVLEPEQLRLQTYAALAAGCRGIGFWTTSPLDADDPASRERLLTITQLNLELSLLEPWLATGSSVDTIPFKINESRHVQQPASTFSLNRSAPAQKPQPPTPADRQRERELNAALIRSEMGAILLPMWLEERSQFVPAQLTAHEVTIVVPGGGETATAWEISTTGRTRNLPSKTAPGGLKITLKPFDQTAAILITSNPSVVGQIDQQIAAIQERSAAVTVELCKLKLDRVCRVDEQLQQLGVPQPDGRRLLGEAKRYLEKAEAAFQQQHYHDARLLAGISMQMIRILQRAHWNDAVSKLPAPATSPFALCFQTLPAHWQLMRDVERSRGTESANKLPSGDLEDLDTLIAAGWKHEQAASDQVAATAELHPSAKEGKLCLRLLATPVLKDNSAPSFHQPLVSVTTPAVAVHAGAIVKISGWVKLPREITGSSDAAMISESLLGKTGAIRFSKETDWQKFELLRVVPESQDLTLTISLNGFGEVLMDDLRITTLNPPNHVADDARNDESPVKPTRFLSRDRFDLRRFSPLPRRN
jgi:hypothetical protein